MRDDSESLDALIALAVRLESRLGEFRGERPSRSVSLPTPCLASSFPSNLATGPAPRFPATSGFSAPQVSAEEPMQIGRTRLTPEERQRRLREGRCIYCGQRGHLIASCPVKDRAHQ